MCWYGSDSSNGLAMVASKDCLDRDVREVRGCVGMTLESMLSSHLVHEGLLEEYSKSQGYQSLGQFGKGGHYVQMFGHRLVPSGMKQLEPG